MCSNSVYHEDLDNMGDQLMPNSNITISNENDADEFDQVELEKLSQQETNDDNDVDSRNDLNDNDDINENNRSSNDDIIPNAIVIKNIPFAIKKEQLLAIIEEMNLPLPYAFNYHFDNGIFRGLAFANFTTSDETLDVIDNLNGKEINGRKLKVEYKKMLPQAERERIEREKREKRGQLEEQHRSNSNLSLQSLNKDPSSTNINMSNSNNTNANNNFNNGQLFSTLMNGTNNMNKTSSTGGQNIMAQQNTSNSYYSQHSQSQYHSQQPQQQLPPFGYVNTGGSNQNINTTTTLPTQQSTSTTERYYAPLPSSSTVPIPPQHLDFNDPDTLEIYSQLLLFKDREKFYHELAYPIGLSGNHKRIINVLCSYLNLVEVYDPRFVIIKRKVLDQASLQTHLQQQGQLSMMHPLQPNSTGGSLNRSHSYTSLLQAHATAAAAAINANDNNVVNASSSSNQNTPKMSAQTQLSGNTAGPASLSAQHSQTLPRNYANQPQAAASPTIPFYSGTFYNNDQSQAMNASNQQTSSQNAQQPQSSSQQQSFLRQSNILTPSSRIPTGYLSNNQALNFPNPLLRNSNVSPPTNQVQPNTNPQRILSSLQDNNSSTNIHEQGSTNGNTEQQLLAQHTNGSIHSNFSIQSYQDDANNMLLNNAGANGATDAVYNGMAQANMEVDLEHHLSRSLSGLDVSGSNTAAGNNISSTSNSNVNRKNVW